MRIQVKIPNSNGVAANQTATWKLPIGRRYHSLQLAYAGITLAQMTAIRVKANGETIHNYTGPERDSLNQYDGRAAAGGILVIPFDRFGLYSQVGEEDTAIQTGSVGKDGNAITDFALEIDIGAAAAPVISVNATQSNNRPDRPGPGSILRVSRFNRVFTASGDNELSDLPTGVQSPKFAFLNRIFFKTANTTAVKVERNQVTLFERSKALNERAQLDGVRVPQAGYVVIDPTEEGYDYEPWDLRTAQDMRYYLSQSAGETVTALVEYIGPLR